jgi:hypothetical protein
MENNKYAGIKDNVQEIIDLIGVKNTIEASDRLIEVSEQLDDFIDHSDDDVDLIEISKYQVLLNQLQQKIIALKNPK